MKKFLIVLSIFLSLILSKSFSQQTPLTSQYTFDKYLINPAFAGSLNVFNATLNVRQQFVGFEGAPSTQTLSLHRPVEAQMMGLGFKLMHDKIGVTNTFNALLGYAYRIGLGASRLSFGLEAGIYNQKIDYTSLIIYDQVNDPAIPLGMGGKTLPDASFGLFYQLKNFYASYSIQHLIASKTRLEDYESNYRMLNRHHFFMLGYDYSINKEISIEPFTLVKLTKSTPTQIDVGTRFNYMKFASAGLLYRSGDALSFMVNIGSKDGTYRIGYSYDYTLSQLSKYSKGGHEIMLMYTLQLLPPAGLKEINPIIYIR